MVALDKKKCFCRTVSSYLPKAFEPSVFGSAPGLPPGQAWPVIPIPFPVWVYCLIVGRSGERWKARGLPWTFLMGFDFHVKYWSSWFRPYNIWGFLVGRTRSRRLLLQLINSEKFRQTSGICCKVKFCYRSCFFLNWISDCVWDDPWRLPLKGQVRGYLPVSRILFICLYESNWCTWVPFCFLFLFYVTRDRCDA